MRRSITLGILVLLFSSSFSVEREDVEGGPHNREKRVSSTAVEEGRPSSNVDFDGGQQKPAKGGSFRRMKGESGSGGISGGSDLSFPIVLPPYGSKEVQTDPANANPQWGSCLLYMESISVILFVARSGSTEGGSYVAVVNGANGKNKYKFGDGAVNCIPTAKVDGQDPKKGEPKEFSFRLEVDVNEPAKSIKMGADKTQQEVYFSVDGRISMTLIFQRKNDFSWALKEIAADSLSAKKGTKLDKDISISQSSPNSSPNRTTFGAFNDYSYACSSTPAAVWAIDKQYSLGVSFNNIQLQPVGALNKNKEGKVVVRFSGNVNDCVGLFSVGSWMGIVVAIVLLMVLFFGFLMLNSVQTMDRFDDPKQKQLIINAKE